MANRSGPLRSVASPSIPACTVAGAPNLQICRGPGSRRGMRPIGRCVKHKDPKAAGVERRPSTASKWLIQRVGVVRNEHHSRLSVLAPGIVGQKQGRRTRTRTQYLFRGLEQGAHLRIAVGRPLDRIAVDAERHIVEKQPAVYLCHVNPTLYPVAERVERPTHVVAVHPHVEREVIACPCRNAHEREVVRGGGRGHDREGAVPASHSEGICAAVHRCLSERSQALAGRQDDSFDALLSRALNDATARGRTPAGPGIDKQHRPPRAFGGVPAAAQRVELDPFRRCRRQCR